MAKLTTKSRNWLLIFFILIFIVVIRLTAIPERAKPAMFSLHQPAVVTHSNNEHADVADILWVDVWSADDLRAFMGRHRILFLHADLADQVCQLPDAESELLMVGANDAAQLATIRRDCARIATLAHADEIDQFDLLAKLGLQQFYNSPAEAMARPRAAFENWHALARAEGVQAIVISAGEVRSDIRANPAAILSDQPLELLQELGRI